MEQLYEIMPCGTKAKELNPLDKLLPAPIDAMTCGDICACLGGCLKYAWQQAESERKEYEIDVKESVCYCFDCPFPCDKHKPGSIHPGIIVNNHKIKIVR